MFDVGFTEIVLILGVALLVLGPEKLPALAEKVGRWTGRARSMARQLRTQLEQEVTLEELARAKAESASSQSAAQPSATPPPPTGEDPNSTEFAPEFDTAAANNSGHQDLGADSSANSAANEPTDSLSSQEPSTSHDTPTNKNAQ
jgi:sec-independent protein translocase protein TatB